MGSVPGAAAAVQPDIRRAIYDARHLGDPHAVAFRFDVSPEFVREVWAEANPRRACFRPNGKRKPPAMVKKLTPAEVAELRERFRVRAVRVDVWVAKEADLLGVSKSTVRRAVYGFGAYEGVK